MNSYTPRIGEADRDTKETKIKIKINIDGSGKYDFPIRGDVDLREPSTLFFLNHSLHAMTTWGRQDFEGSLEILDKSTHHGYEDASLVLGRTYKNALGDRKGIARSASGVLPFEKNRAEVAIDLSGRGCEDIEFEIRDNNLYQMVRHVLMSMARESGIDIYARTYGWDDHHQIEALFKQLGKNIYIATRYMEKSRSVLSTKGKLD